MIAHIGPDAKSRSYLGGMIKKGPPADFQGIVIDQPGVPESSVGNRDCEYDMFLFARPGHFQVARAGDVMLLLRGYAVPSGENRKFELPDDTHLPENILDHYRKHRNLPTDELDGSFTIAIIDGEKMQVLLYRNIVGNGFTYYIETNAGLLFGSNLAELVQQIRQPLRPNISSLPAFFLFRFVPGSATLFDGIHRLMPGELLRYDSRGLCKMQRQTMQSLRGGVYINSHPVEAIEETMHRILVGYHRLDADAINLLSGGVDSSYIQAVWNRAKAGCSKPSQTYAISVAHSLTLADDEYARSAALALGTKHTFVPVEGLVADHLIHTIAGIAEPPNHVQSSYFRHLAKVLASSGVRHALCGEGADSLFGVGQTSHVQMARLLRQAIPSRPLRRLGETLARQTGHPRLPSYLRLAERLEDLDYLDHPVNQVAVFTHLDAVAACFSNTELSQAFADRRQLLRQYEVGDDVLDSVNFIGFFGEAMDSASIWTTLFNLEGCELLCPFLDSRFIRMAIRLRPNQRYPFRNPKGLLKSALKRRAPAWLATRSKRGFGQPIFEWLASGGQLRPLVDEIRPYEFVSPGVVSAAKERPNWFLFSLLCYDLWHKHFIARVSES